MFPWWLTRVQGRSMEPALHHGQLVPTRSLRGAARIRRGDLVVAEPARVPQRVVKRVVGLPGEHVAFRDGVVSVDGRPLDEPYATPSVYRGSFDVPPGHYLLLGDHRDASDDGRSWAQPFVARDRIVGRLLGHRNVPNAPDPGSGAFALAAGVARPFATARCLGRCPARSRFSRSGSVRLLPPAASVAPAAPRS
jgi:signal peptidase I